MMWATSHCLFARFPSCLLAHGSFVYSLTIKAQSTGLRFYGRTSKATFAFKFVSNVDLVSCPIRMFAMLANSSMSLSGWSHRRFRCSDWCVSLFYLFSLLLFLCGGIIWMKHTPSETHSGPFWNLISVYHHQAISEGVTYIDFFNDHINDQR